MSLVNFKAKVTLAGMVIVFLFETKQIQERNGQLIWLILLT